MKVFLAPAKVNLSLRVLGRRADGYHEVETTLLAIGLWDRIEARALDVPEVRLEVEGPAASPDVPRGAANLAHRAAEAVLALARDGRPDLERRGVALRLTKHIPSLAGLGGASSDAAAAAAASASALGVRPPERALLALLGGLGSDCAFFLAATSGHGHCRGRGEVVEPLPPAPGGWHVAVVTPEEGASTAAVYAACAPGGSSARSASPLLGLEEARARELLVNDLEAPALRVVPALRAWRALLDRHGCAHFRLAGSGASFFGLYRDPDRAARDLESLRSHSRDEGLGLRMAALAAPAGRGVHPLAPDSPPLPPPRFF